MSFALWVQEISYITFIINIHVANSRISSKIFNQILLFYFKKWVNFKVAITGNVSTDPQGNVRQSKGIRGEQFANYIPCVFTSKRKWRKHSTNTILCLSNHSLQNRELWKSATDHDQNCSCELWFRWKVLTAYRVHCDLINYTKSTDIKCVTCIVYVLRLCQL